MNPCEDCYTEQRDCSYKFCEAPVEGALGDNIIRIVDDVIDEETCEDICQMEEACVIYTYHRLVKKKLVDQN